MLAAAGSLMVMASASGVASGLLLTTATLGALGFARGGFSVNHMDIAPKYAGVVMGLSNTAGERAAGRRQAAGRAHGRRALGRGRGWGGGRVRQAVRAVARWGVLVACARALRRYTLIPGTAPRPSPNPPGTLSGVIGVALTGRILDANGGAAAAAGWYQAYALAAGICVKAAITFNVFARGEKLFD
jgi:hypothetical protein